MTRFRQLAALCGMTAYLLNATAQEGLVGWWDFDEVDVDQVADRAGHGNPGTITHGVLVKGVDGRALQIDGSQGGVQVPTAPSLSPLDAVTLEAWVRLDGPQRGFPSVIRKNGSYALRFADRQLGFLLWQGQNVVSIGVPSGDWDEGRWYHLAATYDGQAMRLYVDAELAAEKAHSGDIAAAYDDLHIGGNGSNYVLNGAVDEARVYARALAPTEITASQQRGLAALTSRKNVTVTPVTVGKPTIEESVFRKPERAITMVEDGFLWIDGEDFQDYGGWLLDTQFVHLMGSAYLIAAGIGEPVEDARARVSLPSPGTYRLWVRARNWFQPDAPGRFTVVVNGTVSEHVFGRAGTTDWVWESAGEFQLPAGETTLLLRDLTGYYGRCDALVLTTDMAYTPPAETEAVQRERSRLTGLSLEPRDAGEWDVIVVGAGPAGSPAALAAARTGARTALIQNRPVLGGNASRELGVPMNGAASSHANARESGIAEEAGRIRVRFGFPKMSEPFRILAEEEDNLTVFLNEHVFDVIMADTDTIAAVKSYNTLTNEITVYRARRFIDCTGDGWVGYFANADFRRGREARSEFNEDLAPENADGITMSGCLMGGALNYRAEDTGAPVDYTPPPWAPELPPPDRFSRHPKHFRGGQWWMEHRGTIDDIWNAELARDELIRIVFAYWNWIKKHSRFREDARTYALTHIPITEAKREGRRILGDYILTQNDVQQGRVFADRISYGGWPLDVHHPEGIFSGEEGAFDCNPRVPIYTIPYRCLYSRNITNLLMAGRCMSVTHIALGSVRVQSTLATTGQAAGTAAAMSLRLNTTPRGLYENHLEALQQQLLKDDQYIPELPNRDPADLARQATVRASSTKDFQEIDARGDYRAGNLHPMDGHARAMLFPTGVRRRFDSVCLMLSNSTDAPVHVTAHLREAAASEDFSARDDVGVASATLEPKTERWVAFDLNAEVKTPYAWLWVPATEGLSWRLAETAPPGSCRAYSSNARDWTAAPGSYYAFFTRPMIALEVEGYDAENAVNGWTRIVGRSPNMWASDPDSPLPQWLELTWDSPRPINSVYLTFDTNMDPRWCRVPLPRECVRDYDIAIHDGTGWHTVATVRGNFQRRRIHRFTPVTARKMRLSVTATNGVRDARLFEIRVYHE